MATRALWRQRRAQGGGERQSEICEAIVGLTRSTEFHRPDTHRPRRYREQIAARRNAMLAVSLSGGQGRRRGVRTAALPLSRRGGQDANCRLPMMNVINGGAHANNSLDLQEFMIIPVGAETFREAMRCGVGIFHALKKLLDKKGMPTTVGDEGGCPNLPNNEAALKPHHRGDRSLRIHAWVSGCDRTRLRQFGVLEDGKYDLASDKVKLSANEFTDYLAAWVESTRSSASRTVWPKAIGRLENLTNRLGKKSRLSATTCSSPIRDPFRRHSPGRCQFDPDQDQPDRTLTETLAAIEMAKRAGYTAVVSHRSGEPRMLSSPISRWAPTRCRSRPARCRGPIGCEYNQLLASRKISATRRATPAATPSINQLADALPAFALVLLIALIQNPLWSAKAVAARVGTRPSG